MLKKPSKCGWKPEVLELRKIVFDLVYFYKVFIYISYPLTPAKLSTSIFMTTYSLLQIMQTHLA